MTVFFHENGIKIVFGSLKSINHFFLALYFKLMVYVNCCSDTLAIRSEAFFHLSVVGIFHNVPPQRHLLKRNSHIHALKIQHKTFIQIHLKTSSVRRRDFCFRHLRHDLPHLNLAKRETDENQTLFTPIRKQTQCLARLAKNKEMHREKIILHTGSRMMPFSEQQLRSGLLGCNAWTRHGH